MAAAPAAASCMSTEHGCVMFDCLVHLWEWIDPPVAQSQYQMENKKTLPATQQPLTQQHLIAHHVHPDQLYTQHHPQMASHLTSAQAGQIQPNGVMHQLLQSQYQSNMNARSPLLENRHDLYGTGHNHDYARRYGANDNYNYPQSPPRPERTEIHTDHNVNHELLQNIPKGYNAEVYQDYLKRNPPKDTNQIYQNHQPTYRPNVNQYGSKPYLPYSSRIGPQSNTELLRKQYNEIQQMKLQQQMHYQNQAQMHQQQKFAERQLLLQQIHGVQPPPNLQNSIYSDSSYRDLDRYAGKNDYKDFSPESQISQGEMERYAKNNEYLEIEKQNRQYQEQQWQAKQAAEIREQEQQYVSSRRQQESNHDKSQSPPSDFNNRNQRTNQGLASPMKSSESSSPSVKSPSSDSRRSSGGTQALRSPIAQRLPSAPVTMAGILYKQGSDGLKVWRKRWFVLSEYCLFYYKSQDEEKLLGSVLLPSYKVSACTSEDKVLRKYAFKLEHANMRTYILAAPDQEAMMKWVKAMTMAALMQSPNEQPQKQTDRAAVKTEDDDGIPTYANAPPKPRRSNDGYSSPSPDIYDPNYDLLKKPASHYSQGIGHNRYAEHGNYSTSPNQEYTRSPNLDYTRSPNKEYTRSPNQDYMRSPQSPPHQSQYKTYDAQNLSLTLPSTTNDNQPSTSSVYLNNSQSPYFDRNQQQAPEIRQDQIYDRQPQRNPFLQETPQLETPPKEFNMQTKMQDKAQSINNEYTESRNAYNRDVYGELQVRPNRSASTVNERLLNERRTPDAYGRSTTMASYKGKNGDYEDVYGSYGAEKDYGQMYVRSPNTPQAKDAVSISSHQQQPPEPAANYVPEKTFSGPSVLRRKKMQASGIQPPMPRPHSADFLEYESKNEILNKSVPARNISEISRQPQRPKSSLDINSSYDPSSDRYYSEESYAEKMRQSAIYLQQKGGLGQKTIDIPLAKYASGLAQKQLSSAYSHITNNNFETELANRNRDNISYSSRYADVESLNSNWTLKEKGIENQKESTNVNRSGSVMSDGSNVSGFAKDLSRYDPNSDGFMRSASARLPSTTTDKEGNKKVQQREESMKRLLEWKQRMLQSPLTRKSTPATISLARSLNQSRQSLRSDQSNSKQAKTYANASYNSYSSDDEEETSGTDLQKPREMQAGRSPNVNLASPIVLKPMTSHAPSVDQTNECKNGHEAFNNSTENTYENILCTISIPKINIDDLDYDYEETYSNENSNNNENNYECETENGYETHDSEAESETQIEYTDNDLDEVLLESDAETKNSLECVSASQEDFNESNEHNLHELPDEPSTPTTVNLQGEDHYLPMSPRKVSVIDQGHKDIIKNLHAFDKKMHQVYEDNPYVEMNNGNEEEDTQTYELVCINSGKVEPVYMELSNVLTEKESVNETKILKSITDTASNFADTKDHTLKRVSKTESKVNDLPESANRLIDDETQDITLDNPFSRFSISDTFRPASYYLSDSKHSLDVQENLESQSLPPPIPSSSPPSEDFSDDALSKYILDKLDQSDMSNESSILKMLTTENQNMNTVKRKTTSLMIYGSKTSIHDTLSRGEKIRNCRASLNERNRMLGTSQNMLSNSPLELYNNSSSVETDSIRSYNADRGSSRLSLESDVSSKFDMVPSNISSEVASLNENDSVDFRNSDIYKEKEMMMKRRPLSDDSIFELAESDFLLTNEATGNVDLDSYLDNLQPSSSNKSMKVSGYSNYRFNNSTADISSYKENLNQTVSQTHVRCSSTPVGHSSRSHTHYHRNVPGIQFKNISEQVSGYNGSQSSCSSVGLPRSPISYYCKDYDEEKFMRKNLNNGMLADKVKEYENEKLTMKSDINASSTSTGFHSRESSTEHSAPYYYSDLSSQEHINVLPTSHYLKNTNLHRKLNNQRRRGPLHKKNEISHIHNPIKNNRVIIPEPSFELAAARSVSVEFLSATDKDPEIDLKNIYESTGGRNSKIPESMNLSGLGCKRNSCNNSNNANSSIESSALSASALIKLSSTSMSSHCSGNSSNTVYYDAEAETSAYENVMCHGESIQEDDTVWRDNLRRVSHRHARSMDDLDAMPVDNAAPRRVSFEICGMNSIKRVKIPVSNKISRNVTYVNCDLQGRVRKCRENSLGCNSNSYFKEEQKSDDNDVYVSLAESAVPSFENTDEGVYESLAVESPGNSMTSVENTSVNKINKKKFEIDREKLRQWDLMSSGLMKGGMGRVRGAVQSVGLGDIACGTDTGNDSASNEASTTMATNNSESNTNNISNQQALSKKGFLGSNTSIGRGSNREGNIPVRAVSPRVRWVEDKPPNDHYSSQQLSNSQQNLNNMTPTEDSWATARSPSRASQQPIRAVSPRIRRNTENDDMQRVPPIQQELSEIPTAGELLGRTHEELVLLLIQLRRRHAATHRAIEQCCAQINSIEDCLGSLKSMEREENLQRLEQLKIQLMELEQQYEKSKPLVQLVDNMVKLGSLYNRPGSTMERLERNQRLRQKVLAEHALEQQRWLESVAAGKPLETEAARARVAELWALEQELADEAAILQGLKTDKDTIESLLTGVRGKLATVQKTDLLSADRRQNSAGLEAELARVHAMLAHNSKKLEQTVADNARLERELQQLRRALQARRAAAPAHPTAMLEDEVSRVQQLVSALQRQRQELSRAVRHLTQQSHALQTTQGQDVTGKRRPLSSSWQETNLDTGHTIDHGQNEYEYEVTRSLVPPGHYDPTNVETPLYVDTRGPGDVTSPLTSEDIQHGGFANLSNVEKQEIKTVRIVKRESERRQRDRERSLQPLSDWPSNPITVNLDQFIEEELVQSLNNTRASSLPRTDYYKNPPNYLSITEQNMELSPKYVSSPSLTNCDYTNPQSMNSSYTQSISMNSSYSKSYERGYDRNMSMSNQYLNSPTESSRTLTNDPISKTSSIVSLTRSVELSPIFKSEAAKQIITEMSEPRNGSLHRRQVPKEKRRHYTAPHHLSAKTLNEMPQDAYSQDKVGRSLDDADMERALRGPAPDMERALRGPATDVERALRGPATDVERALRGPATDVERALRGPAPDVERALRGPATDVERALRGPATDVERALRGPATDVERALRGPAPDVERALRGPATDVERALRGPATDVERALRGPATDVERALRGPATDVERALRGPATDVERALRGPAPDVERALRGPAPDVERALRGPAPDVVRSALPAPGLRLADSTIDQLLAAPQKILIPERYIPEKPPELSPEEQQKRQEKVESIKKMLTSTPADPNSKSPDAHEKRQREHLLQMNQILAKQVTEMSKIIAVKALEELPKHANDEDWDDRSPEMELPIYQQRDNFFT